jgi:hypothetical protein
MREPVASNKLNMRTKNFLARCTDTEDTVEVNGDEAVPLSYEDAMKMVLGDEDGPAAKATDPSVKKPAAKATDPSVKKPVSSSNESPRAGDGGAAAAEDEIGAEAEHPAQVRSFPPPVTPRRPYSIELPIQTPYNDHIPGDYAADGRTVRRSRHGKRWSNGTQRRRPWRKPRPHTISKCRGCQCSTGRHLTNTLRTCPVAPMCRARRWRPVRCRRSKARSSTWPSHRSGVRRSR